MAHHAITMADGSVAVMQTFDEVSIEECLAKWHPVELAKVVSHRPVKVSDIPTDRTFRGAWVLSGEAIVHDMEKARDIKRDMLRRERGPELEALDMAALRILSESMDRSALAEIAEQKQKLRDAPASAKLDLAETPEDLKALTLTDVTTAKAALAERK